MRLKSPLLALVAIATLSAGSAYAQSGTFSFAVGGASDNRQRDVSKSEGEAYTWGRGVWNSSSGRVYVQAAYETLDMGGADLGLAAFTGIRQDVFGWSGDFQVGYKALIDANPTFDDDTYEAKIDLTRTFGATRTRLRAEYSPDGLGATEDWVWVSAHAAYPVTRNLSVSGEIGYRDQTNNIDYIGANVGATYAFTPQLGLDVRWHGTDADLPVEAHKDSIVAGLSYSF